MEIEEASHLRHRLVLPPLDLELTCRFWQSGETVFNPEHTFSHPTPPFSRVFLFSTGGAQVRMEGQTFQLVPRVIYLLPIGRSFRVTYQAGSNLSYSHIKVNGPAGMDIFHDVRGVQGLDFGVGDLFDEIVRQYRSRTPAAQLRWQSAMFQVVARFCEPVLSHLGNTQQGARRYGELLEYIETHGSPSLTVNELAAQLHVSRSALSKGFRRSVGVSLKSHLCDRQLQRAKEALLTSDDTIKQVATRLGYEDPYYFQRFFRLHTGYTPTSYRRHCVQYGA